MRKKNMDYHQRGKKHREKIKHKLDKQNKFELFDNYFIVKTNTKFFYFFFPHE